MELQWVQLQKLMGTISIFYIKKVCFIMPGIVTRENHDSLVDFFDGINNYSGYSGNVCAYLETLAVVGLDFIHPNENTVGFNSCFYFNKFDGFYCALGMIDDSIVSEFKDHGWTVNFDKFISIGYFSRIFKYKPIQNSTTKERQEKVCICGRKNDIDVNVCWYCERKV